MAWASLALFLTGAGGLALEVVWVRAMGLALGLTVGVQALAVALFLGGNGLGGLAAAHLPLAGRRPLALAAFLALAAGLLAPGLVPLLRLAASPEAGAWLLGGATPLLALFLGALIGGGVSPLTLAALVGPGRPGRAGRLLGWNLLGSVAGALGAGLLVPWAGMTLAGVLGGSLLLAAGACLARCAAGRAPEGGLPMEAGGRPPRAGLPLGSLVPIAFLGGVAALGLELLLFRLLVFRTGAFSLSLSGLLASFLLALGLGSALLPGLLGRLSTGGGVGLLLAWGAAACGAAPLLFAALEGWSPWQRGGGAVAQVGNALLLGLLVGGPAAFPLGALLPVLYAGCAGSRTRAAAWLALAQAGGGVAGAVLVPLLLLPLLPGPSPFPWAGLALGAAALAGLLFLPTRTAARAGGAAGAVLLGLLALPAGREARVAPLLRSPAATPGRDVLATLHDSVTVASAVYDRRVHEKLLFTDGFQAASTGGEGGYMRLLGHLPLLLHPEPRRVLLLMVGTGTTLQSVALHKAPERIEAVEISPAVIRLLGWFPGPGPSPPDPGLDFTYRGGDPRVGIRIADARRFLRDLAAARLRGRDRGADVITQEPLLPYTPAAFPFYTREFYDLARRALAPGGLFVQWIPLGSTPPAMTRSLAATMAGAFPSVSLWVFSSSALLIGGERQAAPSALLAAGGSWSEPVAEDLRRAGVARPEDLLAGWVTDRREALLGPRQVVDDRPFLEGFVRPRGPEVLAWLPDALRWIRELRGREAPEGWAIEPFAAQDLYLAGRIREAEEELELRLGGAAPAGEAAGLYGASLRKDPWHRAAWLSLRRLKAAEGRMRAAGALASGRPAEALVHLRSALSLAPDEAWGHLLHAAALAGAERIAEAKAALREAAWWWPGVFQWEVYREHRPGLLGSLARSAGLAPLLADLEAGRTGAVLGSFRPREAILAPSGAEPDRTALLAQAFPVHFTGALLSGLRGGGEARLRALAVATGVGDPLLAREIALLLDGFDARERIAAARVLAASPWWPAEAFGRLAGAPEPKVRSGLAAALAGLRNREAHALLVDLMADPEPEVREAAAASLAEQLGSLEGFDPRGPEAARARSLEALRGRLRRP